MNNYEELLTSSYALLQSMDNHHGVSKEDNYDLRMSIIDEVINSPPEQREQWLLHLLATIEHLFDTHSPITNHELFSQNPIASAKKYIEFEKQQHAKTLT